MRITGWDGAACQSARKPKAIENLENYTKRVPGDQNADQILDAVRNDKVNCEQRKPRL